MGTQAVQCCCFRECFSHFKRSFYSGKSQVSRKMITENVVIGEYVSGKPLFSLELDYKGKEWQGLTHNKSGFKKTDENKNEGWSPKQEPQPGNPDTFQKSNESYYAQSEHLVWKLSQGFRASPRWVFPAPLRGKSFAKGLWASERASWGLNAFLWEARAGALNHLLCFSEGWDRKSVAAG